MNALQPWFERRWYGGVPPGMVLRGLSAGFAALAALRRWAYRRGALRSQRLPVPVLVVGNLALGGSGKTPLTIALVEAMRRRGWSPGVVSRGHGGREHGPLRLPGDPDPARFGDEPCLIAARTGAPVAVGRRRAAAGGLLLDAGGVDLLIADDGLQHYALQRDVEIVLIDARRGLGNGRLLPAGPLRELPPRAAAADFRVGAGGAVADAEWTLRFDLGAARPLTGGAPVPLRRFVGQPLHAVAGIADPQRFFAALRAAGLAPDVHAFADHHPFDREDFAFDDGRPLLMTEKDAVKCAPFARDNWHAVALQATLPDAFYDAVSARLHAAREGRA